MKSAILLPLLLVAACDSGPTEAESLQVFAATVSATSTAQSRATVTVTGNSTQLDWSGACSLGGTMAVTGLYNGVVTSGDRAAFDLSTTFDNCAEGTGTLDGGLHWTSVSSGNAFDASMVGDLSFKGSNVDASCAIDLHLLVDTAVVLYSGSLCGYDVVADLHVAPGI